MRTGRHRNRGVLQTRRPYLRLNRFQGARGLQAEKKTLPWAPSDVAKQLCVAALVRYESAPFPTPSQGILTLFPFAIGRCVIASVHSESTRFWLRTD